jgi:Trk K+ transport system NAD-binding subunit
MILCTQKDGLNLQIAVKARRINPKIQIVIRIFDDDFAQALHEQFGFSALSATGMAAPAFAAAAAGVDMTRPITIEGQSLSLAKLTVADSSDLSGLSISQIEQNFSVSVVLLRHQGEPDLHPAPSRILMPGDTLAILGGQEEINTLVYENSILK